MTLSTYIFFNHCCLDQLFIKCWSAKQDTDLLILFWPDSGVGIGHPDGHYSQDIVIFLVSNAHIDSKFCTYFSNQGLYCDKGAQLYTCKTNQVNNIPFKTLKSSHFFPHMSVFKSHSSFMANKSWLRIDLKDFLSKSNSQIISHKFFHLIVNFLICSHLWDSLWPPSMAYISVNIKHEWLFVPEDHCIVFVSAQTSGSPSNFNNTGMYQNQDKLCFVNLECGELWIVTKTPLTARTKYEEGIMTNSVQLSTLFYKFLVL